MRNVVHKKPPGKWSKWTPCKAPNINIEGYCSQIQQEYMNLRTDCKHQEDNLSKEEIIGLKELTENKDIIIKKADKAQT